MSLGVPLLSVDEVREFGGIPDEEDGCIVKDPIPISFVCSKLDREPTGISCGVGRSRFATDG